MKKLVRWIRSQKSVYETRNLRIEGNRVLTHPCPSSAFFCKESSLLWTFTRDRLPKPSLSVSEWAQKPEKCVLVGTLLLGHRSIRVLLQETWLSRKPHFKWTIPVNYCAASRNLKHTLLWLIQNVSKNTHFCATDCQNLVCVRASSFSPETRKPQI